MTGFHDSRTLQRPLKLRVPLLLLLLLSAALAALPVAAAPISADFWDCNTWPQWPAKIGNLWPNCCKLKELLRKPEPLYKTWNEYVEQSGLQSRQPVVRRPAHLLAQNDTYLRQLDLAYHRVKALPNTDPRSLFLQMNFHCIYGSPGVVHQPGRPDLRYVAHNSWLFFPFHRWYTFFFERILATLVEDDSFALPFWNWDNQSPDYYPLPNVVPPFMRDPNNFPGLFSYNRHPRHLPGAPLTLVNLNVDSSREGYSAFSPEEIAEQRRANNAHLHRVIVESTAHGEQGPFLSYPVRAGEDIPDYSTWSQGFEAQAHLAVHIWLGDPEHSFADMGVTYHAVRDPLFFLHHANVDRMWNVWLGLEGRSNYDDPDFLDAAFFFYDEFGELVRVTIADGLDSSQLKYTYQEVENPWIAYGASSAAQEAQAHSQA